MSSQAQRKLYEDYVGLEDEQLVELVRGGDEIALEYMISKYKNFVRAKARSYFLIGADREDIIQEGMIGLYKAIRISAREASLLSSLRRAMYYQADYYRHQNGYTPEAYSSQFLCIIK